MQKHDYTLKLKEVPITLDSKQYVLVELDGTERDKYLGVLSNRVVPGKNGQTSGVKNFDGLQASLVSMSLFECDNGERKAVPAEVIQKWPARVINALFNQAQALSALDQNDAEEGND